MDLDPLSNLTRAVGPHAWHDQAVSLWQRLLHQGQRCALPHAEGNDVALLRCGGSILEATRKLIQEAHGTLHAEIYAWGDDATGRELLALFQAAQARGVVVRILVDHLGSWNARGTLSETGLNLRFFHSIGWFLPWRLWHRRNHRKLILADGQRAVVGSANWTDAYNCGLNQACYRDLGVLIQGPVVPHLEADFLRAWRRSGGLGFTSPKMPSPPAAMGDAFSGVDVQVVSSLGKGGWLLRRHVLLWLRQVRHRVLIANAYFIPDPRLVRLLQRVARRGVEVDVLVPGSSDHPFVQAASRATFEPLLKAGVRVWERQEVMLHAKAAVLDEDLLVVGSANLDTRSFRHNLELNLVLRHKALAREAETLLARDRHQSTRIEEGTWARRPLLQKMWQHFAHLFWWWL
jgi:cardiolipin synthase A/B